MPHISQQELAAAVASAKQKVKVGAHYAHYKHPELTYVVVDIAILEATDEPCVIYTAEYGERITFVRSFASWSQEVEWQGAQVPRFALVKEPQ